MTNFKKDARPLRKLFALIVSGLIILCVGFVIYYPLKIPDGTYYYSYIGCEGDAHLVFQKGEFHLTTPECDQHISDYSKENGVWVIHNEFDSMGSVTRSTIEIQATVLGIRTYDQSSGTSDKFLFRSCFAWLPKSWSWIKSLFH